MLAGETGCPTYWFRSAFTFSATDCWLLASTVNAIPVVRQPYRPAGSYTSQGGSSSHPTSVYLPGGIPGIWKKPYSSAAVSR